MASLAAEYDSSWLIIGGVTGVEFTVHPVGLAKDPPTAAWAMFDLGVDTFVFSV